MAWPEGEPPRPPYGGTLRALGSAAYLPPGDLGIIPHSSGKSTSVRISPSNRVRCEGVLHCSCKGGAPGQCTPRGRQSQGWLKEGYGYEAWRLGIDLATFGGEPPITRPSLSNRGPGGFGGW